MPKVHRRMALLLWLLFSKKDTPKPQRVIGWQSIMLKTSMPVLHVEMCRNRKERRSSAVL